MENGIVIYCTVPTDEVARKLATILVEARAAACVNIIPSLVSVYYWDNSICTDDELLLLIKTKKERYDLVAQLVKSNHPYDVPELIALPIVAGSNEFLKWLENSVADI